MLSSINVVFQINELSYQRIFFWLTLWHQWHYLSLVTTIFPTISPFIIDGNTTRHWWLVMEIVWTSLCYASPPIKLLVQYLLSLLQCIFVSSPSKSMTNIPTKNSYLPMLHNCSCIDPDLGGRPPRSKKLKWIWTDLQNYNARKKERTQRK